MIKQGRWQFCKPFVDWLVEMNYIEVNDGKIREYMSGGVYLYMWEAWRAAEEHHFVDPNLKDSD